MAGSSREKDILDGCARLTIEAEDEGGLILEENLEDNKKGELDKCLVGSFITNKKINFMAMQDTLSSIWRPVKGVFMKETNFPNVFVFKFFHDLDLQRVMDDGPWTFNQQVLLLKKLEEDDQLANMKLSELFIWLQVYDLPVGFNSEYIHKAIGNYVGKFLGTDPKNFQGLCKNYIRIKVGIDINRPLKSRMRMKKSGGDWLWLSFKYERLQSFCFFCGLIGHSEKFCEYLIDNPQNNGERKYNSSLRAPVRNQYISRDNQWLRGADGNKIIPGKEDADGEVQTGKGKEEIRSDPARNEGQQSGIKSGIMSRIRVNEEVDTENLNDVDMSENEGIAISQQKRARVGEFKQQEVLGQTMESLLGWIWI